MIVTSSPSRIHTVPRPMITIQWNFDQGRRSSRAGTSVSMARSCWALAALASLLIAAFLPATAAGQSSLRAGERWQPAPRTSAWQWQLQGKLDTGLAASVYDVDGFETTEAQVA